MKKLLSLFITVLLIFSAVPISAEEIYIAPTVVLRDGFAYSVKDRGQKSTDYSIKSEDTRTFTVNKDGNAQHFVNGGFEYMVGEDMSSWKIAEGNIALNAEDIKSGKNSVHIKGKAQLMMTGTDNGYYIEGISTMMGGRYELSVWAKRNKGTAYLEMAPFYNANVDGYFIVDYKEKVKLDLSDLPIGEWAEKTITLTLPDDVERMSVNVYTDDDADILLDDMSLIGPKVPAAVIIMPDKEEPLPGAENLLYDGGFEADSFEWIEQAEEREDVWFSRTKTFPDFYSITDEAAHSGSHSMKLSFTDSTSMPWFGQVVATEPGVTYQVSGYIMIKEGSQTAVSLQADSYKDSPVQIAETYVKEGQSRAQFSIDPKKIGEWQEVVGNFTAYGEADYYALLLRVGSGYPYEMYFDDFTCVAIKESEKSLVRLQPDDVFYYSDREKAGTATLITEPKEELVGRQIRFRFMDGEEVLNETVTSVLSDYTATYSYPMEYMAVEKKEYTVEATLLDANGAPTPQSLSRIIYRYPRPTQLDESMQFITNGGKVMNYVLAQGTLEEIMYRIPEIGGTVGRAIGSARTSIIEKLDIAEANGMMATVTLYNHQDIRDPAIEKNVRELIALVKDHPALLGYYLWEEPGFSGDNIDLDENLRIGTKIIKDLDPVHPIGSVISEDTYYGRLAAYNDWMDLDCYPAQAYSGRLKYIADNMASALKQTDWQKNMSIMIQAFEWFDYKPTWETMRNMIYQSFMEGGSGFSFHTFDNAAKPISENGSAVRTDDEYWQSMEKAAEWEYDFMFDHFVNGKYPMFAENKAENARWRLAVVDNTLYAIVLNMKEEEATHVDIPLVSFNDKVKIGEFTAELLTGGDPVTIEGSETFSADVTPSQAAVYKITPKESVDFSAVRGSHFRDLYNHVWAREAIINLNEKGIVNQKSAIAFGAGDNITRGDYAMFLVRALGLTGGSQNFSDVNPAREYAKEIAAGKAAGILEGVGDNKFNPDSYISRQDIMTMTSRALKLTESADLSSFSDAGKIADYAQSHVAAMVAEGLIKGNADGTLNPLGNTTRAEAAVIINRLITK